MRNQLELLFKVQTIDTNIINSEKLQAKYHDEIAKLEEKIRGEEDQCKKEQERLEELEKEHRNLERSLNTLEDQKKKIEDKLLAIKTNKEYHAALQEIETVKESLKKKEDETITNLDKIDSEKTIIKKLEVDLKESKSEYEEKKRQIEEELKNHLDDIEKQKEKRVLLVEEIDADIFSDYKRIQKVRHGYALAIATDEQCMGCSMKIPPQIYNEVVFAEKIKTCPHCNRILYVQYETDGKENKA